MDEPYLLERIERLAAQLGEERVLREQAERKAERGAFNERYVMEMVGFMAVDHQKIEAIKLYRQLTGIGLKESKDAIERVTNRFLAAAA